MIGPQPMFLNAAATGESMLSAPALLDVLLAVEQRFGRERPYVSASRTIDLDLILYGNEVIETEGLTVPHPRFRERRFVLEPLAEIAADWIDPVTGKTIGELLKALGGSERTRPTSSTREGGGFRVGVAGFFLFIFCGCLAVRNPPALPRRQSRRGHASCLRSPLQPSSNNV